MKGPVDRLRTLLGLESGTAGGGRPITRPRQELREAQQQLREARRRLGRLEEQNAALRASLASVEAGGQAGGVLPENVVWVFGSGRTGSSWLTFMMGALPGHTRWNEPLVGYLFGHLYYTRHEVRRDREHYILAEEHRGAWVACLRRLVLEGGAARFPERIGGGYLVIKEPHGSIGAPLLAEAVPESRVIFLVRDPRDVVASAMAVSNVTKKYDHSRRREMVAQEPEEWATTRAGNYLRDIEHAGQAFDAHPGPKTMVRYEDLRADTLGTMRRLYGELGIPVREEDLVRVVEARVFERVPEEKRGPGTIRRKARPGGWREDLTQGQIAAVERAARPILERFYPA